MFELDGKNAIVTGGSRGIGAAVALALGNAGCNVIVNYTSASSEIKATSIVDEINSTTKGKAYLLQADVGADNIGEIVARAAHLHFANGAVDIIVHNAGVSVDKAMPAVTPQDWAHIMNINARGPFFITQSVEPMLADKAKIIFMSSVSARAGFVDDSLYAGSKAAIEAYIKSWPKEQWARSRKISVNGLAVGPCETDMFAAIPQEYQAGFRENPVAEPTDIANLVLLLCSEKAIWINGSIVNANNAMLTN
ncbi:hypothetical protein BCR39DRAFT_542311 [Naematelia encephala]|uniref:Ketoreductase domain-containing protein n=1 Tax=Naematelia encephala TaxID=71784 RepID=A0A1Y2AVV1_9TREE|nr:hypothetical protein BCR39DRAFT_542311 [Naematelia encephala]